MPEVKIQAETRHEFGKGAARRVRRADKVPAVLYGHGTDPVHLSLPGHDLMLALKNANALLSIDFDGKAQLALPRQVQRDPIKGFLEHVDLLLVRRGEKVVVDVAVHVTGQVTSEAMVVTETAVLSLQAEATHIPESVEVSVEGLPVGSQIHASDLQLPEGISVAGDFDPLVVNVVAAPTAEEVEAELAEAEADVGIERGEAQPADDIPAGAVAEAPDAESADTPPESEPRPEG